MSAMSCSSQFLAASASQPPSVFVSVSVIREFLVCRSLLPQL
jgi:hypothetical protein